MDVELAEFLSNLRTLGETRARDYVHSLAERYVERHPEIRRFVGLTVEELCAAVDDARARGDEDEVAVIELWIQATVGEREITGHIEAVLPHTQFQGG